MKRQRRTIERVQQKHRTSCVPACVAMLAGISYERALALVHPKREKGQLYLSRMQDACSAFKRLGIKHRLRCVMPPYDLSKIKHPAMLKLHGRPYFPCTHAVVWDPCRQRILDPWGPKPDLSKKRCARAILAVIEITENK